MRDEELNLSEEEISFLETLLIQNGWNIFLKLLDVEFNAKYKHLRNTRKTDLGYARINGFLDGIERASKVISETISAYRSMKLEESGEGKKHLRKTRTPVLTGTE